MRRFVALILMVSLFGCSVPDDGTYNAVVSDITSLSPEEQMEIARDMAIQRFYKWYVENAGYARKTSGPQQPFVRFKCSDDVSDVPETWHDYKPFDVWACMNPEFRSFGEGAPMRTFAECMRELARDAASKRENDLFRLGIGEIGPDDINCDWEFLPEYDPPADEWEPNTIGSKDIANEMIAAQAPPWWLKFLGIAVVGGVVIGLSGGPGASLLPALCTLGGPDHWSCPSDPAYPPGQTPQPDR